MAMDADTAKRLDAAITRLFNAEAVNEFDRIGFLEIMKTRLEAVWIHRYHAAED
jgi:hypothetical protein